MRKTSYHRRPRNTEARLRAQIRQQNRTIAMLREEIGSMLDLVPMVNVTEGVPDGVVQMVLGGSFVPHIAQLLATCLVAFKGTNLVEWEVVDPHGRGDFILTIQRREGLTSMQIRAQTEERLTEIQTRWYELLVDIGPALDAYEAQVGTLEHLLDTLHAAIRTATQPIGSPAQRILADITDLVRKEDHERFAPHQLAA